MMRVIVTGAMLFATSVTVAATTGTVELLPYYSKVLNQDRRVLVYLPVVYGQQPKARFPVLYLRHGGGSDENNWLEKGDAPAILDELIGSGKAAPMIVVFTRGQPPADVGSPYDAPGLAIAGRELMEDVVPLVQSKYRVSTGGANRAIAGLSMGGGQTFAIGQTYSSEFSAMGVFSAGTFGTVGSPTPGYDQPRTDGRAAPPALRPFDAARDAAPALADPEGFNRRTLLYISVGDQDPRAEPTGAAIKVLRERGLNVVATVYSGKHEWSVWKLALADFVPRLFGGPQRVAADTQKPWGTPTLTDWNSVWSSYRGPLVKAGGRKLPEPTPEYAPFMEANRKAIAAHKEVGHGARCLPSGVPGLASFTYPAEIIVRPNEVAILYEYTGYRRIRMNSEHPDYVEPSFVGDAVAHWEADTLVIDTVGITTKTVFDSGFNSIAAARHSNQLHVIERMREVHPGIIEIHIWMEDPRAFVKPVEWVSAIQKTPDEQVNEHICEHSFESDPAISFDAFEQIPEPEQSEVHWARPAAKQVSP
jgi:enterochelin esterase-like enzyme